MPKVFPEPPTSYIMMEDRTVSGEFDAPEDGWYQLDACSRGGYGSPGKYTGGKKYKGATGGSGGIVRKTKIALSKGEKISFTISGDVIINDDEHNININVTAGGNADYPFGGTQGLANGGDININGSQGRSGALYSGSGSTGRNEGVSTNNDFGLIVKGGDGGGVNERYDGSMHYEPFDGGPGTPAFIRFYRGNTNIPLAQQNALAITSLMLEMTEINQWQTGMELALLQ